MCGGVRAFLCFKPLRSTINRELQQLPFRYLVLGSLPGVLPAEGPDVVLFHLVTVEVVLEGFGVFEGEAVAVGEEVVEAESCGVDFASGVGSIIWGGHIGHHHGNVFVSAIDATEELGDEPGRDTEVVVEFFGGPSGGKDFVTEGVAVIVVAEADGGIELGSPGEVFGLSEVGDAGLEVPGSRSGLHAVGELGTSRVLFINGAGGDAEANGAEEGFFVPRFDVEEAREGEIAPIFGAHFGGHAAHVDHVHFIFDVVGHEHEG